MRAGLALWLLGALALRAEEEEAADGSCAASSPAASGDGGCGGAAGALKVLPAGARRQAFPSPYFTQDKGRLVGEDLRVEIVGLGQAVRQCVAMVPECKGFTFEGAPRPGGTERFKVHFKGDFTLRFRTEDGSDKWVSYRWEQPPAPRCPLLALDHLFKAGGNSARGFLARLGLSDMNHAYSKIGVRDAGAGAVALVAIDESLERGKLPVYRLGMARSPCDYILSVWSFQRVPNQKAPSCAHSSDICGCLQKHKPAGTSFDDFLPVFKPGRKAMKGQPARFAEGELDSTLEEDRARFGKWLRLMAGNSSVHLLSSRFYSLIRRPNLGPGPADCPVELNSSQQELIREALARESGPAPHFSCMLHTESLQEDVGRCALAWAESCDVGVAGAMADFIKDRMEKEEWRHPLSTQLLNAGSHQSCRDFMTEEDQAFIWQRERRAAEVFGYKTCCH